jgi:hypothetical protein
MVAWLGTSSKPILVRCSGKPVRAKLKYCAVLPIFTEVLLEQDVHILDGFLDFRFCGVTYVLRVVFWWFAA